MANDNSIEKRAARKKAALENISVNEVKEAIINDVLKPARLTRVKFEKLKTAQQIYLIERYLGTSKANEYEAELVSENGLSSSVSQGLFSREFVSINESTDVFSSLSERLNKKLYGIYNKNTRLFLLLESYRSMMKHINEENTANHVLSTISIPSTSINVKVESLDNYELSMNIAEIKSMLDSNASSMIGSTTANTTILTESLALSLLDIREESIAADIINNFENQPSYDTLDSNIINENYWNSVNGWNKSIGGFSVDVSESSQVVHYIENDLDQSATYIVEMQISKYDKGSLTIFFGGDVIYNDTPSREKLSFSVSPGNSRHSILTLMSSDLKCTIEDISIRKIIS